MSIVGIIEAKKWLSVAAVTVKAAQEDKAYIRKYGRIVYNLDFNLLAPLIADAAPIGLPKFFIENRDHYASLIEQIQEPNEVVISISEPTVLEVMDMLLHKQNRLAELERRATEYGNRLDSELPLNETEAIQQEFKDFISRTKLPKDSKQVVNDLIALLNDKKIVGTGDLINKRNITHSKNLYARFNHLYKQQHEQRSHRDTRPPEDKEFHYKIDALNICITLATASSPPTNRIFFVSGTGLNTNLCIINGMSFGRKPLVPVFVQNAIRIDGGANRDIILDEAYDYMKYLLTTINKSKSLNDRLLNQMAVLKGTYLDELSGENKSPHSTKISQERRDHFDSPKELRKAAKRESLRLKEGANSIASEIEGKLEYLERFRIFEDPIIKRIEKELEVKLNPKG